MSQINSPLSNPLNIPREVQAILAADERVLQSLEYNEQQFFATNKRLIICHIKTNPAATGCMLFGFLGAFLGSIISSATTKLEYVNKVEYSGISGITINSHRNVQLVLAGAIFGFMFIAFAFISAFSIPPSFVGAIVCLGIGVIAVWLTCFRKFKHYQLEIPNLSSTELKKWRLPTGKRGEKLVTLIKQQMGR